MELEYKVSYRTKDGSIQCIINYKDNGEWKQKAKQGFKTQKESKPWQDKILKMLKNDVKVPTDYREMTFGEFKDIFLKDKEREYAYNSIEFFESVFVKFEDLNDIPLTKIAYINIKPCVDKMIDEGLSESNIKDHLSKMKTVLNHAIENYEIMKTNPIKVKQYKLSNINKNKSKNPKKKTVKTIEKKTKVKALNKHEVDDLLSKLKGKDYMISLIAVKCGLRIGEIIGLVDGKEGAFDFKNNELHIFQQWKKIGKKEWGFGPPKSNHSYRKVPIPISSVPIIKEYVQTCVKDMNNRVFLDRRTSSSCSRLNLKYKRLGYDISVHDLRHTYATDLVSKNVSYETIAKLMGDTVQMIIKTYSHVNDDMFESARAVIDENL